MVRWPQHKAEDNEVTDSNNMRLVFKAPTQERPQLAYLPQSRCFPLKARSSTLKIILIKCILAGWLQARDDRNKLRAHAKEKRSAAKKVPPAPLLHEEKSLFAEYSRKLRMNRTFSSSCAVRMGEMPCGERTS